MLSGYPLDQPGRYEVRQNAIAQISGQPLLAKLHLPRTVLFSKQKLNGGIFGVLIGLLSKGKFSDGSALAFGFNYFLKKIAWVFIAVAGYKCHGILAKLPDGVFHFFLEHGHKIRPIVLKHGEKIKRIIL